MSKYATLVSSGSPIFIFFLISFFFFVLKKLFGLAFRNGIHDGLSTDDDWKKSIISNYYLLVITDTLMCC